MTPNLAKVGVEGSNPFARSNDLTGLRPDSFVRLHATSTHEVIGNDRPGCNPADLIYDIVDRAPRRAQIVGRIFRVAPGAPEIRHMVSENTGDLQLWNATCTQLRRHRVTDGVGNEIFIEAGCSTCDPPNGINLLRRLGLIGDEEPIGRVDPMPERWRHWVGGVTLLCPFQTRRIEINDTAR